MTYLAMTAALVALINIVCVAIDKLMLRRHKPPLYLLLRRWWQRLDATPIPDFPRLTAEKTLSIKTKIFGESLWSIRGALLMILFSLLLTSVAVVIGDVIEFGGDDLIDAIATNDLIAPANYGSSGVAQIYLVNLVFDALTVAITFYLLRLVVRKSPLVALGILLTDMVLALVLAFGCYLTLFMVTEYGWELSWAIVVENFEYSLEEVVDVLTLDTFAFYTEAFFASTTLVPTLAYTGFLIFLFLAKPIASLGRGGFRYTLERAIEDDPRGASGTSRFQPFTLFGVLLSVIGALAGTTVAIRAIVSA